MIYYFQSINKAWIGLFGRPRRIFGLGSGTVVTNLGRPRHSLTLMTLFLSPGIDSSPSYSVSCRSVSYSVARTVFSRDRRASEAGCLLGLRFCFWQTTRRRQWDSLRDSSWRPVESQSDNWDGVRGQIGCRRGGEATLQVGRQSAAMMETKEGGLTAGAPIFNRYPRNQSFKTSSLLENSRRPHSKRADKHMWANMWISIFREEDPRIQTEMYPAEGSIMTGASSTSGGDFYPG